MCLLIDGKGTPGSVRRGNSRGGFSLMEMLLVLVIMALLAGITTAAFSRIHYNSMRDAAKLKMKDLSANLERYELDMGSYPTTAQGLKALKYKPAGKNSHRWRGPYVKQIGLDPWHRKFIYRFPGTRNSAGFDLLSTAEDEMENENDVVNWLTDDPDAVY